jgi:hypothetical protein
VSVVCCYVDVSATGRSLVQRSPAECGVSECDREASKMRRPWPTGGRRVLGGGGVGIAHKGTNIRNIVLTIYMT